MNQALNEKALAVATEQVTSLLSERWPDICRMRDMAAIEAGRQGKDKFNFVTSLSVIQEPKGTEIDVATKISCGFKLQDETAPEVASLQGKLEI